MSTLSTWVLYDKKILQSFNHLLHALSLSTLQYDFTTTLHARLLKASKQKQCFLFFWSILCNLTSLLQQKFVIKWKSHDISGSASLALWANMNQSTTQLGSRRQSQGKPAYLTFNIFKCCHAVIICSIDTYM